jgi:hypothetical protein
LAKLETILGVKKTFLVFALLSNFASFSHAVDIKGDILDQEDYDPDTPYYQIMPPSWAFGFRASIQDFPVKSSTGNIYEFLAEWLIPFQKAGIVSIGAHLGVAPFSGSDYGNYKYGGLVRYQLNFLKNQIIVPTAALVYDGFSVKDSTGKAIGFSNVGPLFGALLNLGFFDSSTARDGFESIGLLRSYLSIELRPLSISNSALVTSDPFWYLGVRLETE